MEKSKTPLTFKVDGREFFFTDTIESIAEATGRSLVSIEKRRNDAMRLAADWITLFKENKDLTKLASSFGIPPVDMYMLYKRVMREKKKWAGLNYSLSDEELSKHKKVSIKRLQYYRKLYDPAYVIKKQYPSTEILAVSVSAELRDCIVMQSKKLGMSASAWARMILTNHWATYDFGKTMSRGYWENFNKEFFITLRRLFRPNN